MSRRTSPRVTVEGPVPTASSRDEGHGAETDNATHQEKRMGHLGRAGIGSIVLGAALLAIACGGDPTAQSATSITTGADGGASAQSGGPGTPGGPGHHGGGDGGCPDGGM